LVLVPGRDQPLGIFKHLGLGRAAVCGFGIDPDRDQVFRGITAAASLKCPQVLALDRFAL
jgi:hypothetical protein